jgi:hypothetical protein
MVTTTLKQQQGAEMPVLTLLQVDNMIHALKQHKKYDPYQTLEQAYIEWKKLANSVKK